LYRGDSSTHGSSATIRGTIRFTNRQSCLGLYRGYSLVLNRGDTPVEGYIGDQATMTGGGVAVRFALQAFNPERSRFTNRQS